MDAVAAGAHQRYEERRGVSKFGGCAPDLLGVTAHPDRHCAKLDRSQTGGTGLSDLASAVHVCEPLPAVRGVEDHELLCPVAEPDYSQGAIEMAPD